MCACRAPLQDGRPVTPPIINGLEVVSQGVMSLPKEEVLAPIVSQIEPSVGSKLVGGKTVGSGTAANPQLASQPVGGQAVLTPKTETAPIGTRLAASPFLTNRRVNDTEFSPSTAQELPVRHLGILPPEPSSTKVAKPARQAQQLAPVVTQTDNGVRLERIESMLKAEPDESALLALAESLAQATKEANKAATEAAKTKPQTNSAVGAVYMRVNDESNDPLALTNAQLDTEVGTNLGSPFGDDAGVPLPQNTPLAPVVEPGFLEQQSQLNAVGSDGIIVDEAALPIDQQPIIASPAPYEEYLPYEEIPIEVAPEQWAADPHIQLNIPQAELARLYPDEYICDGGDAGGPVRVRNDWSLQNLDPEDTVGHYDTLDNRVVVEPSNKVCIYAPRFASARKVSSAFQNEKYLQALLAKRKDTAVIDQANQLTDQYSQTVAAKRHSLLQPASGLKVRTPGIELVRRQPVNVLDYDLSTHEDFRVIKFGVHKQSEKAAIADFAAKAITWSHDKAVQVVVDEEVVQTRVHRQGIETIFFIGDNGPAKLRVIKTASKADALPGEEIEFTLRFDNIGYQKIGNVTIIDNLTTRLEFVDDSDLCSEECDFLVDENDVESLTLRWEIKDPIDPGKGGLIRFRCVVR